MFRSYLAFCMYFGLVYINPLPTTICYYIQFLARTFVSPASIINYVSAINLLHMQAGYEPPARTFIVNTMLRAIKMTMRHVPRQSPPMTSALLHQICNMCDQQGILGKTLKSAYLLLFFSFVRQSNIAPRTSKAYDFTRHLSIADIFFSPPGAIVLIKWTKTIQHGRHVLLPIPQFRHRHCPVRALRP